MVARRHIAASLMALVIGLFWAGTCHTQPGPADLRAAYQGQVDRRLDVPPEESRRYGQFAVDALVSAGPNPNLPQYVALVDRSPKVQAIFIYWLAAGMPPELIGASPVSTGRGGEFDHFETPLGVFEHTTSNPDFRAEGTRNENGIRGYGVAGMRVFDFGWQQAERLWGRGGLSTMRLQMHATDPDYLEPRLGTVQSKGCIRIPASLNQLLDRFGVLDADYLKARSEGSPVWVLPAAQVPVDDGGRYLVIIDTQREKRPAWASAKSPARQVAPHPPRTSGLPRRRNTARIGSAARERHPRWRCTGNPGRRRRPGRHHPARRR